MAEKKELVLIIEDSLTRQWDELEKISAVNPTLANEILDVQTKKALFLIDQTKKEIKNLYEKAGIVVYTLEDINNNYIK
ncbi:hypothetical protein ISS09_04975 [Candidatus Woesearchaeota archaeon]|nr:hypothetical protein [Candidatus Woesearchaeota archaeon]